MDLSRLDSTVLSRRDKSILLISGTAVTTFLNCTLASGDICPCIGAHSCLDEGTQLLIAFLSLCRDLGKCVQFLLKAFLNENVMKNGYDVIRSLAHVEHISDWHRVINQLHVV